MLPASRAGMQVPHVVRAAPGGPSQGTRLSGEGVLAGLRAGPCVEPGLLFGFCGKPRGGAEAEGDLSFAVGRGAWLRTQDGVRGSGGPPWPWRPGEERSLRFLEAERGGLAERGAGVTWAARRASGRPAWGRERGRDRGGDWGQDFRADGRWRIPTGDLGRDPWDSGQKSPQLRPKCGAGPRVGRWPYRRSEPWNHGVHLRGNKLHVPRGVCAEGHTDHRLRRRDVGRLPPASQ